MFRSLPILGTIAYLLVAIAVSAVVYIESLRDGYRALAARAEVRLSQQDDKFLGQITRYQQLANTLARHPDITTAIREGRSANLDDLLLFFALSTGADEVFVVDVNSRLLATSDTAGPDGDSRSERRLEPAAHIRTALNGGLGWSHGLEADGDPRTLYFARAIFDETGPVIGAVAVSVRVADLEFEWSLGLEPVAYFDSSGVVFVTNRPELALLQDTSLTTDAPLRANPLSGIDPIFPYERDTAFGFPMWRNAQSAVLPDAALFLTHYLPRVELTGVIFQDVRSAHERALLLASLTALSLAMIGLLLLAAFLRRRALSRLLQAEEDANEMLEARVVERTTELRETQRQLVAASRLSALGEMSAGISHELNQPLAAIRTFAENGRKLIDRGQADKASDNFEAQIGQVDRIGRIIRSLRAFARNEEQQIEAVDLTAIVDTALSVSDIRLRRENIAVTRSGMDGPVFVRGGQVRLQQVLVNIIGNAIDAMAGAPEKTISLDIAISGGKARLTVTDTGPGVAEPDKVFDPFYSTKDPGGSSGMGLGLSISHGIVGTFGGTLMCRNRDDGTGAEFSITLPLAED